MLKKLFGFSAISVVQSAVSLLLIPITTRYFSPDQIGRIGMFNTLLSIWVTLSGLCCEQSYIRFCAECDAEEQKRKLYTKCLTLSLCSFTALAVLTVSFGEPLSYAIFDSDERTVVCVLLPVIVFCSVIYSYRSAHFRMSEDVKRYTLCGIGSLASLKLPMLLAAFFGADLRTYALICALMYAFFTVSLYPVTRERVSVSAIKDVFPVLKYALPFIPSSLMTYLGTAVTGYILKENLSYSALGIYNTALSVSNVMTVIQSGFAVYWPAFMYKNYETHKETIKKMHSAVTFVMALLSLLVMLFSRALFMLIGKDFREGMPILGFLLFSPFCLMVGETVCYGIYLKKKTYLLIYVTLANLIFGVAMSYVLIPKLGLLGASVANAASAGMFLLIRWILGQRYYKSTEKPYRTVFSVLILIAGQTVSYLANGAVKVSLICILIALLCALYAKDISKLAYGLKMKIKKGQGK